ncbi:hypothetical protein [Natrinema gelatinilyticum]|nr:hypothetical protein [Natrinema gelatinilyticum]
MSKTTRSSSVQEVDAAVAPYQRLHGRLSRAFGPLSEYAPPVSE